MLRVSSAKQKTVPSIASWNGSEAITGWFVRNLLFRVCLLFTVYLDADGDANVANSIFPFPDPFRPTDSEGVVMA